MHRPNKFMPFALTAFALLFVARMLNPSYEAADRTGLNDTSNRGSFKSGTVLWSDPSESTLEVETYAGQKKNVKVYEQVPTGINFGPMSIKDGRIVFSTPR